MDDDDVSQQQERQSKSSNKSHAKSSSVQNRSINVSHTIEDSENDDEKENNQPAVVSRSKSRDAPTEVTPQITVAEAVSLNKTKKRSLAKNLAEVETNVRVSLGAAENVEKDRRVETFPMDDGLAVPFKKNSHSKSPVVKGRQSTVSTNPDIHSSSEDDTEEEENEKKKTRKSTTKEG